ncbi:hypothetical protein ACFL1G_00770 [Planctomycetota bacterium]
MNSEEIYNKWKAQRIQIDIADDFADEVMTQIYRCEEKRRKPLLDIQRFVEFISTHPLVKAAMITVGAVIGVAKLVLIIQVLLYV